MKCERPVMWEHFEVNVMIRSKKTLHGNVLACISSLGFHISKLRLKKTTKTKQNPLDFSDTTGKLCVWTQSSYDNKYGKFKPEKHDSLEKGGDPTQG